MMSPTARSLELLREMNYECQVVEYFNSFSKKRVDLFGIIDIVAAHPTLGILGVQATTGSNHSARFKKACRAGRVRKWLVGGAHLQIWSWRKAAKKIDGRIWTVRTQSVTLKDLVPE